MRLTLVRHGQTAWNAQGLAQGHTDVELCVLGLAQAEALADRLASEAFAAVLSSDLLRCRQTLAPFVEMTGLEVDYRPELRERSFGDWEGSNYAMLHDKLRTLGRATGEPEESTAPPNGESIQAVWGRLGPVADELQCLEGPTLVVGHGGALALLAARLR
jgi:broad specificity phosphatase PhoE